MNSYKINKVVTILKKGGVVICPTDTVYGFIADASNKKAVEKIYKIKKRPKLKPLSLFVKDFKMAGDIALIDNKQLQVLKKYWPGKYTFVLRRQPGKKLHGLDKNTVAMRIPEHKFLQSLIKKIDRPLAQTSVNVSNENALNKINDIMDTFGDADVLIIDGGNIKKARASKIVDLTNNKVLRK